MERDLPEDDLVRDPIRPEEPGPVVVLRLLRKHGVEDLDDALLDDVDRLTDVFLDHAEVIPGTQLLYLTTLLLGPKMNERARALCERYFLMLNVSAVGDEAVLRCFSGFLDGKRQRPFTAWCEQLLRETARWAVDDVEFLVFSTDEDATPRERIMGELSNLSNHLEIQARRVVWLHRVEHRTFQQIAAETGMPLERAEWIADSVLEQAKTLVIKDLANRHRKRRPSQFEVEHGIDDRDFKDELEDDEDEEEEGHV